MDIDRANPYFSRGKWYWFDETWLNSEPYDTKEEAEKVLDSYVKWLNGEKDGASST